jgi:hypothetical protein
MVCNFRRDCYDFSFGVKAVERAGGRIEGRENRVNRLSE